MGKRTPKVTEDCKAMLSSGVKEFASAIHNYGVERLYSDLRSNGKTTSTYTFSAFADDFKRMKNGLNGFLNEPALLGAICALLQFPTSALFGGPISNAEENREIIKSEIRNTMHEVEKEKKIPKKRISNDKIFMHSKNVYFIIQNLIFNKLLGSHPIISLFILYSSKDKSWDHNRELRIKNILEKILCGQAGHRYIDAVNTGYFSPFGYTKEMEISDAYWNHCLTIAYQLSCMEKLYSFHQKSKLLKIKSGKEDQPIVHSSFISQEVSDDDNTKDIFAEELKVFCTLFDNVINMDYKNLNIYTNLFHTLHKIVCHFQSLLNFLINPLLSSQRAPSQYDDSLINYFTQDKTLLMNTYVLKVTDKELGLLRESTQLFRNLHDSLMGINIKEDVSTSQNPNSLASEIQNEELELRDNNDSNKAKEYTYDDQDRLIDMDSSNS
jgi:hypothetical protein